MREKLTHIFGSRNNLIFNNSFKNSGTFNAKDYGFNNQGDNGVIGNLWDDYIGIDANHDGIGDTSYQISGTAGSFDNYPIWVDPPVSSLVFSIVSPVPNEKFSINAPYFAISIEEGIVNSIWYTLDDGLINITFT